MVKKLYKHEFLAWLRVLPIFFGITLLTAGFHRILQLFESDSIYYNIINISALVLFFVSVMVSIAAPIVFGIIRFYKNLFTGEGYLTFTLPVKTTTHIWVKSLTTLTFCVGSAIVCFAAFCLITAGDVLAELWNAGIFLLEKIPAKYAGHIAGYVAEGCVLLLIAMFATIMLYNSCLCIGQLAKKNRILLSVGAYFGYYLLTQVVGTVFVITFTILETTNALVPIYRYINEHPLASIHQGLSVGILWYSLLSLVFFLVCRFILRKKLNLE